MPGKREMGTFISSPLLRGMAEHPNPKSWQENIANSAIIGMIALLGAIAGTGFQYPPTAGTMYTSLITGALAFLLQWAYERRIKTGSAVRRMVLRLIGGR